MSFEKEIEEISQQIKNKKQILILTHRNPDGDAIGSGLAWVNYLTGLNKSCHLLVPNQIPDILTWMPGIDKTVVFDQDQESAKNLVVNADLFICVDFNAISRISEYADQFFNNDAPKILIDHHPNPEDFARIKISTIDTSSTAELVYRVLGRLNNKSISKEIAECLYVGMVTDTGSFSYNSSYPETFNTVSELLKAGIDKDDIHKKIYNNYSADRIKLLGYSLNKMTCMPDAQTAFIALSKEDLSKYNYKTGDTEGFVNYPLSIANIKVSALFVEMEDKIKISFRSRGTFPVNEISAKYFNGGGHRNAAGGESNESLDETIKTFETAIQNFKDKICNSDF